MENSDAVCSTFEFQKSVNLNQTSGLSNHPRHYLSIHPFTVANPASCSSTPEPCKLVGTDANVALAIEVSNRSVEEELLSPSTASREPSPSLDSEKQPPGKIDLNLGFINDLNVKLSKNYRTKLKELNKPFLPGDGQLRRWPGPDFMDEANATNGSPQESIQFDRSEICETSAVNHWPWRARPFQTSVLDENEYSVPDHSGNIYDTSGCISNPAYLRPELSKKLPAAEVGKLLQQQNSRIWQWAKSTKKNKEQHNEVVYRDDNNSAKFCNEANRVVEESFRFIDNECSNNAGKPESGSTSDNGGGALKPSAHLQNSCLRDKPVPALASERNQTRRLSMPHSSCNSVYTDGSSVTISMMGETIATNEDDFTTIPLRMPNHVVNEPSLAYSSASHRSQRIIDMPVIKPLVQIPDPDYDVYDGTVFDENCTRNNNKGKVSFSNDVTFLKAASIANANCASLVETRESRKRKEKKYFSVSELGPFKRLYDQFIHPSKQSQKAGFRSGPSSIEELPDTEMELNEMQSGSPYHNSQNQPIPSVFIVSSTESPTSAIRKAPNRFTANYDLPTEIPVNGQTSLAPENSPVFDEVILSLPSTSRTNPIFRSDSTSAADDHSGLNNGSGLNRISNIGMADSPELGIEMSGFDYGDNNGGKQTFHSNHVPYDDNDGIIEDNPAHFIESTRRNSRLAENNPRRISLVNETAVIEEDRSNTRRSFDEGPSQANGRLTSHRSIGNGTMPNYSDSYKPSHWNDYLLKNRRFCIAICVMIFILILAGIGIGLTIYLD